MWKVSPGCFHFLREKELRSSAQNDEGSKGLKVGGDIRLNESYWIRGRVRIAGSNQV